MSNFARVLTLSVILSTAAIGHAVASDADQLEADWKASNERLITHRTYVLDRPVTLCVHRKDWQISGTDHDHYIVFDFGGRDLNRVVAILPKGSDVLGFHDALLQYGQITGYNSNPNGLEINTECGKPIS